MYVYVYVHVMMSGSSFTDRLQPQGLTMLIEPFTDQNKPVVLHYYITGIAPYITIEQHV